MKGARVNEKMKKKWEVEVKRRKNLLINTPFRNNKSQIKIQEMAFVLLALALLGSLAFIFTVRLQTGNIQEEISTIKQQRALSLREKIAAMPELKCARKACIDLDKAKSLKSYDLEDQFQGLVAARIVQIYPTKEEIVLYSSGKTKEASYSTFVNLCEQVKVGTVFDYDCGLALLVVDI